MVPKTVVHFSLQRDSFFIFELRSQPKYVYVSTLVV